PGRHILVLGCPLLAACMGQIAGDGGHAAGDDSSELPGSAQAPIGGLGPASEKCRASPADVGFLPLPRLTRNQYLHVTSDLLPGPSLPASVLPSDERMGQFASNVSVGLTEVHVTSYIDAAEKLAADAVSRLDTLLPCTPAQAGAAACARQFVVKLG